MSHSPPRPAPTDVKAQKLAIQLSLATGLLMLAGKWMAYWMTGSAAILSDAAESVVHIVAVAFAAFSLYWSMEPEDSHHLYGHQKIGFLSAGFEGAMIILAAAFILYSAVAKWISGLALENLGIGTLLVAAASGINGGLGGYLIWQGRKHRSLILEANGKHVLTDVWTSIGVVVGLILTMVTGWLPFDPLMAIAVALNILWSGGRLMRSSFAGLMDEVDPEIDRKIRAVLEAAVQRPLVGFHGLRHRNQGSSLWVEIHLLYEPQTSLETAHAMATQVENRISQSLPSPAMVTTHLEPAEAHDETHLEMTRT